LNGTEWLIAVVALLIVLACIFFVEFSVLFLVAASFKRQWKALETCSIPPFTYCPLATGMPFIRMAQSSKGFDQNVLSS
jgi:hypothetical protein